MMEENIEKVLKALLIEYGRDEKQAEPIIKM